MFSPFKCTLEPPSFVMKPESQAVLPNTTVRFKSTFKGTPPFTVKWFKEDTELITGPTCFTGMEGLSCFIDLLTVGVLQSGTYSCQVSNDAGTVKCTTDLLVKGWTSLFFLSLNPIFPSHHSSLIVTFLYLVSLMRSHHPITAPSLSRLFFSFCHGSLVCFFITICVAITIFVSHHPLILPSSHSPILLRLTPHFPLTLIFPPLPAPSSIFHSRISILPFFPPLSPLRMLTCFNLSFLQNLQTLHRSFQAQSL